MTLKLGLIGLKGHESVVIKGAIELGDVELVAIADDNPDSIQRLQSKQPFARKAQTYADWRQMLEHSMIDVCCACDENVRHPEQIIALAARNIHVVTEKPLATSMEGLQRVRSALARSKSRLTMLLTMRHEAQYMTVRELVRGGAIGVPCQVTTQKSYRWNVNPPRAEWLKSHERLGGTIPYIGIHTVDLMRWTTGLEYTQVAAFHGNIGRKELGESEDTASLLLRMSNGAVATSRLDYLRPDAAESHGDDRLRIAGSEGVIEVGPPNKSITLVTNKQKTHVIPPTPTNNLFVDFMQNLRANLPIRIPEADCLLATEIVLKARQAAEQMKIVELVPPVATG